MSEQVRCLNRACPRTVAIEPGQLTAQCPQCTTVFNVADARRALVDLRAFEARERLGAVDLAAFGRPRPVLPHPKAVLLVELEFMCAHANRWRQRFSVTWSRVRAGDRFRVDAIEPDRQGGYRAAVAQSQRTVSTGTRSPFVHDDFDQTGWACYHCGTAPGNSHAFAWVNCGQCGTRYCTASVHAILNGGIRSTCPGCGKSGLHTKGTGKEACGGTAFLSERLDAPTRPLALEAPRSDARELVPARGEVLRIRSR